ncbi:hypothetical protein BJ138DRAFT_1105342 [Hygrophoropsis aurantiaca]|uniref:Uncharacterized protein n=1 Tax=Hygrophoropsis aurantiaca TaxID=72124 RepID=A0ACB7ZZJ7_9AGAM|nr:hypothetical protein BJ138DRAFT_1105342 [Hygrophoropsis aurantiaca]
MCVRFNYSATIDSYRYCSQLPIGSQPPASSYKLHDNFFDSDSIDLDDHEHTQIFSIPRTRPTAYPSPTDTAVERHSPASRFEALTRIWKRISMTAITGRPHSNPREDRGDGLGLRPPYPHPISTPPTNVPDMQPLPKPPHTPTPRVVKVSAGYGFSRTHAATSDEDDPVPCCDYLCFCMCCPCKRSLDPDSDLESDTES